MKRKPVESPGRKVRNLQRHVRHDRPAASIMMAVFLLFVVLESLMPVLRYNYPRIIEHPSEKRKPAERLGRKVRNLRRAPPRHDRPTATNG